jgi:BolA family transcriptional regulator, general stress-responsive regulator
MERLESRIRERLAPSVLELRDDSALHAGHAGARGGHGHFTIVVVAPAFAGLAPLRRHRLVYDAVGDMMQTDIHALTILAHAPGEPFASLETSVHRGQP